MIKKFIKLLKLSNEKELYILNIFISSLPKSFHKINGDLYINFENGRVIIFRNISEEIYEKFIRLYGELKFKKSKQRLSVSNWTDKEISFLKTNYTKVSIEEIAKYLKKSPYQVHEKITKLKLVGVKPWTNEEIEYLQKNIYKKNIELAQELQRPLTSIKSKKRVILNKNL